MSPGVRIKSGHLKNRLRPYSVAGISRRRETALFHRLYAYFTLLIITTYLENANLRKLWFRALHEMRAMPYGPQTIF